MRLIKCLLEFESSSLEFYLDQREAIDKDRYIIAILINSFDGYLTRHLEFILTPVVHIEEFDMNMFPIISHECYSIPEDLRTIEYISLI